MKTLDKIDRLKQSCKVYEHKSGIKIYVCEKPEFNTSFAIYGTRYGSTDTMFKKSTDKEYTTVPEGIAHFLEHKLFENEDCDVFEKFSKLGASSNAYTSFDRTCYYFSCTDRFDECFEILLDFVQSPYFTKETVDKEQGIIGQEISMYDDSPSWMLMFDLLAAMYHNHPVKINICGTKQSISEITPELLYYCYDVFYNPANMFICVCGNVDAEHIFDMCDKLLKDKKPVSVDKCRESEPYEVAKRITKRKMPIAKPLVSIGFKEKCETPLLNAKDAVIYDTVRSMIFDSNSEFANNLIEEGIVGSKYDSEMFQGFDHLATIVSAETDDPDKFFEKIKQRVDYLHRNGLDKSDFERNKKHGYGSLVRVFDDVECTSMCMVDAAVNEHNIFDAARAYEQITFEDVQAAFEKYFNTDNCSLSIIEPA